MIKSIPGISTKNLFAVRFLFAVSLFVFAASATHAIPLPDYHAHVRQAVTALDSLAQNDETESTWDYGTRSVETVQGVRNLLPPSQNVEWNGTSFNVDNSWLHQELDEYSRSKYSERLTFLRRTTERLQAISERLAELQTSSSPSASKEEERRKLAEILQRAEYARKVKGQSFLTKFLDQFVKWFQNLFPKPKPLSPDSAGIFSLIAQIVVVLLAVGVLVFVLRLFLPRLLRQSRSKKKEKQKPRIVLGEQLEPDQSATDLLSDAEVLARRGELRAAIRKAYIALLVELGDRKLIRLAQHKTNRDYLRAMRELQPLYGNVKQLTESFERHWYGLAQATENDWLAFRSTYERALSRTTV
jgi:hypothetical protein